MAKGSGATEARESRRMGSDLARLTPVASDGHRTERRLAPVGTLCLGVRPAGSDPDWQIVLLYKLYNVPRLRYTNRITHDRRSPAMKLVLKRIGNSTGLILPKELLARLGLAQGDAVIVTETPTGLAISKETADERFAEGIEIARKAMKTYRRALAELAK